MTAPLSGAVSGATYSGTQGGLAGDFARAAGNFIKGMKDEEAKRQARAMEQALLDLRIRAQQSGDEQAAAELDIRRQQLQQARENAEAERKLRGEDLQLRRESEAAERDRYGRQMTETERHNREQERVGGQRADIYGDRTSRGWKPTVIQGPNGEILLVDAGAGTVAPTRPAGTVPTAADGTPVGSQARPAQGEREAAAAWQNLESAVEQLDQQMAAVDYTPPSMAEQVALDAAQSPGSGIGSSVKRGLANSYLGKRAPQRQQIEQSVKTLGTLVVKMVTGAQMSEPEAQRIMGILRTVAGDQPELAKQKIETVREIIRGQRIKLGRAASMVGGGDAAQPTQMPAPGSSLKQKYGLE